MTPRWLSRLRNVRAFDRFPYRQGWRRAATTQGLDPDRVENLARWLARSTTPIRAWSTAVEHLVGERDAMVARLLPRRHSCPTCDRLRHPSAAVDHHPTGHFVGRQYPELGAITSRTGDIHSAARAAAERETV